jgi:two-component system sensor histidine kinase BaeS
VQVEAVEDGVLAADGAFLRSIGEEVASLSRLVDDLQQLSLAEAGVLRLERVEVSIAELIDRAASGISIPVTREIEDFTVHVDPHRIVQVLRNLLVNASTYARSSIHIAARGGEIRVSDDGPGVPEEHRGKIFDRFHRADASRSRSTGGAGLGLAIAKELVELHGGSIRLEGANTFVFTLPERRRPAGWPGGVSPPQ